MSESEKPLVTFSLFAYNQEKYIREAVEGAFVMLVRVAGMLKLNGNSALLDEKNMKSIN